MLEQFQDIAEDNTSGATELIRRLLAACEAGAIGQQFGEVKKGVDMLKTRQISMPSLHTVLHILSQELFPLLDEDLPLEQSLAFIAKLQTVLDESGMQIAKRFSAKWEEPARILTLSRSATVLAALNLLADRNKLRRVTIMESRPLCEGVRTIRDCAERGVEATLLADAALGEGLRDADCVVSGADGVSSDGFLLNKIGTYPLAVCAREAGVPFYVLCDSLKFSPQTHEQMVVEDRPPDELLKRTVKDKFFIWNKYFEWTPIEYVTQFITERGVYGPNELSGVMFE